MANVVKAWFYQYKNPDPYRWDRSVYMKEADAILDAAQMIGGFAASELENIGTPDDDDAEERAEKMRKIVLLVQQGKSQEAYDEWREYADEIDPDEDVAIEEIDLVLPSEG